MNELTYDARMKIASTYLKLLKKEIKEKQFNKQILLNRDLKKFVALNNITIVDNCTIKSNDIFVSNFNNDNFKII